MDKYEKNKKVALEYLEEQFPLKCFDWDRNHKHKEMVGTRNFLAHELAIISVEMAPHTPMRQFIRNNYHSVEHDFDKFMERHEKLIEKYYD